jgi:hypothetical protein
MPGTASARRPAETPSDPAALRDHVLDTLDELAVVAAEQGEVALARSLWACWGQINPDLARAPVGREIVWIETPARPGKRRR